MRIIIIGLGKQSLKYHLPSVLETEGLDLVGLYDNNQIKSSEISSRYGLPYFNSLEELIQTQKPKVAIVSLPHICYLPIIKLLIEKGIHVLKEKPFSISDIEANEYTTLIGNNKINFTVSTQRRFNEMFEKMHSLLPQLGTIFSFNAKYCLSVKRLDEGWRAKQELSGGGALIDMGYHYIDLLLWFFGIPKKLNYLATGQNRVGQSYDVEDTAVLSFLYENGQTKCIGNLYLTRIYPIKTENLSICGTNGSIVMIENSFTHYDLDGNIIECFQGTKDDLISYKMQLKHFIQKISSGIFSNDSIIHHKLCYQLITSAYKSINNDKWISIDNF